MTIHTQTQSQEASDLLSWVFGNQDYDQSKPILIDADEPERSFSANEARSIVRKLIAGFTAAGLQKGDCVCLHAFNHIMYPVFVLAVIGAGGIFTGTNPSYTQTELTRHMAKTSPRFLLVESKFLSTAMACAAEVGLPDENVFALALAETPTNHRSWTSLLDFGEADWIRLYGENEVKNTTAALLSTSGTSGFPKAAMISHQILISEACMIGDDVRDKPYQVSRLIALPVFHAFAFPITHILALRHGTPTYLMRRFDLTSFLSHIRAYDITETAIVPSIITTILKRCPEAWKSLRSLRTVWCAGSPLLQTLQNEFFRQLRPTARLIQVWGMTEAGWITTFLWPEKDHSGSVGRLLKGMEAKIMQDGKLIADDNVKAEIFVRGPTIMQGYLGDPEATSDAIDGDGWLKTGDIAYRSEGKFYIVDREKEIIKVRGWQISPAELEVQLLQHPSVADAAVIGVPGLAHETELPRAYIVEAPGTHVIESDIKEYMSTHLAGYKSLDGGVMIIDTIPKNSTGKILRKALRERAAVELALPAEPANDPTTSTPCTEASPSPTPSEQELTGQSSLASSVDSSIIIIKEEVEG